MRSNGLNDCSLELGVLNNSTWMVMAEHGAKAWIIEERLILHTISRLLEGILMRCRVLMEFFLNVFLLAIKWSIIQLWGCSWSN